MPAGRPSDYKPETVEKICDLIAEGMSLRKICAEIPGMPEAKTVHRWLTIHEEFRQQYAHAREQQADLLADECIEIADDESKDILDVGEGGDARSITNSAAVQRAKLRVDARKWKASQMFPKKWAQQHIRTELTGEGGGPVQVNVTVSLTKAKKSDTDT